MAEKINRIDLRKELVIVFSEYLEAATEEGELQEALSDIEEIERFIIGETE